jgi:hypothetical protein
MRLARREVLTAKIEPDANLSADAWLVWKWDGDGEPHPPVTLQRRELLGPALIVRCVEAEVDDLGAGGARGSELFVGEVAAQ